MTKNKTAARPGVPAVRCAIYTRKSTEEGLDQEFNSLDAQREAGEAYITSQAGEGWTPLALRYDDGGFTGGNMERPALQRLLADIRAGKIDCVIVYKVDRLSRSLLDFAKLIETFEKHKVAFVSVTQQFNTANSMGRLVLNVLLSFAQFEREIIGERIRDKIAATKKKGKWAGGFPVLGYDVDRTNGRPRLVPNAKEMSRVREIFRLYLDLGSLLPVVEELNRRGWKNKEVHTSKGEPRGGKAFNKCTLYALLINPIYIGMVRHKTNVYPGEHEAIVDKDVFEKVQNLMRKNARAGGPLIRNRYGALLRGIMFCKGCDRTMVHTFSAKGHKRYRYYTCTAAIKEGRKACPSPSLPAAEVERVVVEQIRDMVTDTGLEGLDENNVHRFHHALTSQLFNNTFLPTELLLEYDQNIVRHTQKLNERRITHGEKPIVWKYFQYLALLFTEVYLDWYFAKPDDLRRALNEQIDTYNADKEAPDQLGRLDETVPAWTQLNKLAYWMATGSGKTLLMHANILQYQFYLEKHGRRGEMNRIILLTPNEGLTAFPRR